MSIDFKKYLRSNTITTFKDNPTTVQDTLLELIGDMLDKVYTDADQFTDTLLDPWVLRPDIINAKAAQYDFHIREEASLSEQLQLLDIVKHIYSKRGSIDSIENMWRYYGGNLPKDVKVKIPAKTLFRYSGSKWSGTDKFQDGMYNRSGVYTLDIDGSYDLVSLKEFVDRELRAAGTVISYNKVSSTDISSDNENSMVSNDVYEDTQLLSRDFISIGRSGLIWSTYSPTNTWSGHANLLVNIARIYEIGIVSGEILAYDLSLIPTKSQFVIATVTSEQKENTTIHNINKTICTPSDDKPLSDTHYYDVDGNDITNNSRYPGYFVLGETLLSEVITK